MLSGFLDWFEENKVGVIGTLTLHSLVLFACTLTSLRAEQDPLVDREMSVDVISQEEMEEVIENKERMEQGLPMKVTNLSNNITAQVRPYINQQRLAESVEQDLRSLEKAEFDRLAQERAERGETAPEIPELDPSKWNKELYMNKAAEPVRVEGATTVWHDLKDRVRGEGVPGYLCRTQGRVAVRVSVGQDGVVQKAEFDPSQSVNADECMLEQAMRSARNTRFNALGSAPTKQNGTVYFMFLPQ